MKHLRADGNGYGKQVQPFGYVPALVIAAVIEKNDLHRLSEPDFDRSFPKGWDDPVLRIQCGRRSDLRLLSLDGRKSSDLALPLKNQHAFVESSPEQHCPIEFEQHLV